MTSSASLGYYSTLAALLQGKVACEETPFWCRKPASLPLLDFVRRIGAHMHASDQAYIVGSTYLVRLQKSHPNIFGQQSAHKISMAVIVVAAKWTDDAFYANSYYAQVGGISLREMNRLELEVLRLLDFNVFVTTTQFIQAETWIKEASVSTVTSIYAHLDRYHVNRPSKLMSVGGTDAWDDQDFDESINSSPFMDYQPIPVFRSLENPSHTSKKQKISSESSLDLKDDEFNGFFGLKLRDYGPTPCAPFLNPKKIPLGAAEIEPLTML
eukprot:c14638_g1_i1.p1 GENE.c14638_g1_i1~~c14638_g1_i1.p1  ORF type:complete len:269 (+),score=129.98 c14638_g1_i1:56-862(+)